MSAGEAKVRELLRVQYPAPEWSFFSHVAMSHDRTSRFIDAAALNLWASRGYVLHGFEIKRSRADWLRELKNPAKAEAFGRYCDYWWIVAASPDAGVRKEELPEGWGLMIVVQARKLTVVVRPAKKVPAPWPREFMVRLLGRAGQMTAGDFDQRVIEATEAAYKRGRASAGQSIAQAEEKAAYHEKISREARAQLQALENRLGLRTQNWPEEKLGAVLEVLRRRGAENLKAALQNLKRAADNFSYELGRDIALLDSADELDFTKLPEVGNGKETKV